MKKITGVLFSGLLVMSSMINASAINVHVNNKSISMDVSPVIVQSRTLVPVAAIAQALEGEVDWDAPTRTVTITRGEKVIKLQLDNNVASINSENITLDVPAQAVNGRTMVPVGFIAQAFGEKVEWHQETKTVLINSSIPGDSQVVAPPVVTPPVVVTPPSNPVISDSEKEGTWIKGNVNSKIYHVPGGRDYGKVSPQNIVWFETESDALDAGFRKAMQ